MSKEFPFEISPMFEGERVRKDDMYIELAGPKSRGFELVRAAEMDEVEDGRFTLIGPDISGMEEGSRYPLGMIYRIAGEMVEPDLEAIVERRNHDFQNYIQGMMHLNQRYDVWIRISKDAVANGLCSFEQIAKIEATYITDIDERTRNLHDEDVDVFYGCSLCQSFAPTSVCVITPDRIALCGAINWFDGRAAAKVDPEGPQFAIEKGECLDEIGGEYSGVNETAMKMSGGCFEVVGFYIPEVDGIGWVDRDYTGTAPNGLPFSTMAGQTGGGKQITGFLGVGANYFRSPKFIQADGGWDRVVWMPKHLKDKVKDDTPPDMMEKVATEDDAADLDSLRSFLIDMKHPVVSRWEKKDGVKQIGTESDRPLPSDVSTSIQTAIPPIIPFAESNIASVGNAFMGSGGIKLILKNAKISINKIEIRRK